MDIKNLQNKYDMDIHNLPDAGEFWKRPEFKAQGDDDLNKIFLSMGRSLHIWEKCEANFVDFFGLFAQSYAEAARRAYGTIISARSRQDVLNEAALSCFDIHKVTEVHRKIYAKVMQHYSLGGTRRNEIAHAIVQNITINQSNRGHFLLPATYNTKKNKSMHQMAADFMVEVPQEFAFLPGAYRYTSEDIDSWLLKFAAFHQCTRLVYIHFIQSYPEMRRLSRPPDSQIQNQ